VIFFLGHPDRHLLLTTIEDALSEASRANIDIPLVVMAERVGEAWQKGTRDREKLRSAALSAEIIPLLAHRRYFVDYG
jgi:hypothetical protein